MEVAMRIKIKGEITAESLAEALHAAAEKYEAVRPGHKVYGANLYLTAFDADGLPFDLADHRGEPLSITIEAKSGELVKPALTAEGEARRQKAKEEARKAEAEAQRRHRQALDEYEQERQKRLKKEAEARKQFEDANATTAELLKTMPERFIDELNKTVQGVWDDLKPTETQGKKKGQPKALPVFSVHADGLFLSVETWKNPRRVLNPLCTLQHGKLMPFWAHDAWSEAMRRIVDLLDTLTAAPADALESP